MALCFVQSVNYSTHRYPCLPFPSLPGSPLPPCLVPAVAWANRCEPPLENPLTDTEYRCGRWRKAEAPPQHYHITFGIRDAVLRPLGIASVSRSTSFTPTTTTSATALDKDCIQRHTETPLQCRRERYCPGLHSRRAQPLFSERRWAPEAMRPSSPAPRFVHP